MAIALRKVYILSVEEQNDYIFTPVGVVAVTVKNHYKLYCLSSDHNRLAAVLNRHEWPVLEQGVVHNGAEIRLTDITEEISRQGFMSTQTINQILTYLYQRDELLFFFLKPFAAR